MMLCRPALPLAFLIAAFAAWPAAAALPQRGEEAAEAVPVPDEGLRLAQWSEVEVFYDEYGRRVLLDTYTGEILAIEEPRRNIAPWVEDRRIVRRAPGEQERYNLNDPRDRERYRYETGRDPFTGRPIERYREPPPLEARPAYPPVYEEPRYAEREPIMREPLPGYEETVPEYRQPALPAPRQEAPPPVRASEDTTRLQVLLDRAGASPGVIDGMMGDNVRKALLAYEEMTGETLHVGNPEALEAALAASGGPAFTDYTITAEDAAIALVASIPEDYGEKAKLEKMAFTSVAEMLAERFHMDERYLRTLNPEADFGRPGTIIRVANVGTPVATPVARIVADKGRKQVRAYDQGGNLVAAYPATIGSASTPSPTGTHTVERIALNPEYTYNPRINFQQGDNDRILRIPPGPNGPVGTVWIALSKPTYGIHGTPEPSKIGKTESNGCIRLTNWDAEELAKLVSPGVFVQFIE